MQDAQTLSRPFTTEELAAVRTLLAHSYSQLSDEEVAQVLIESTRNLSAEELENLLAALGNINWGNVLSGAMGGAATGATIGSVVPVKGTIIGGGIGALLGGLGGALSGPPPKTPQTPAPTPTPPTSNAPLPGADPGVAANAGGAASSAITALMTLLQNPQVVSALTSALSSAGGRKELQDDSESSAERLPEEASERIVRKLNNDLGALARFRQGVADTSVFPHSAICQLRMQMSNGGNSWFIGTGFYIAPDLILTAGHNVLHGTYGRATRMEVRPGRNGASEPFGRFDVAPASMFLFPAWASQMVADNDMAVLRVGNRAPNGHYFAIEELRANPASGVVVCGYAADTTAGLDANLQHLDYDSIRSLDNGAFTYSLHTTGGTSGSPVFYVDGRRIVAVGVHSRGFSDTENKGCRLTDQKVEWIRRAAAGEFEPVGPETTPLTERAPAFAGASGGLAYLESVGAFAWSKPSSNNGEG